MSKYIVRLEFGALTLKSKPLDTLNEASLVRDQYILVAKTLAGAEDAVVLISFE